MLVLLALAFMTIVYFMSVVGSRMADNDPMLDPDNNRMAKIGKENFGGEA